MRTLCTMWIALSIVSASSPCLAEQNGGAEAKDATGTGAADARLKDARRPKEFFSVFNFGYAGDNMPKDVAQFETLVGRLKAGGYSALLCKYSDERAEVCKKHGMKMMVDLLAPDHHVSKEGDACKALCEKLRDNPVVLAYHLWSDRLGPAGEDRARDIRNVQAWDPTHPTYIGGYRAEGMSFLAKSDFISYRYFPWRHRLDGNFPPLIRTWRAAKANNGRVGRFVTAEPSSGRTGKDNISRHLYTLNTSIACGLKGCLWFIGQRTMDQRSFEWNDLGRDIIRVHGEIMPMRKELAAIGNPVAIYSTPITKTHRNRALPGGKERMMPPGLEDHAFPKDLWIQPAGGEFVMGVFKYPGGGHAVFVANHNTYAPQDVKLKVAPGLKAKLFNRKKEQWEALPVADGVVSLKLDWAGGELLRFDK